MNQATPMNDEGGWPDSSHSDDDVRYGGHRESRKLMQGGRDLRMKMS
jgi:hypothetical protein